jgi:hypothetical protein
MLTNIDNRTKEITYFAAASAVIREYLESSVLDSDIPDFWGARTINDEGGLWYGYTLRVTLVGESLFLLRNTKGFKEICSRLKARNNLRSAYYEMLAAKTLFRNGFDIEMRPETGEKGQDFDFTAFDGHRVINVEVTALAEKEFYKKTAINALFHKRSQLPDDKPAAIFCILPARWETEIDDISAWMAHVANHFFLKTLRVNAVVFMIERHIDLDENQTRGGFTITSRIFEHPRPRYPLNVYAALKGRDLPEEHGLLLEIDAHGAAQSGLLTELGRQGEFFEWVDSPVPDLVPP